MTEAKAARCRALRYKRPALATMGFDAIEAELEEISTACDDVTYFLGNEEDLLDAFDGDAEEAWEFRIGFADLSANCYRLQEALWVCGSSEDFDDCTVALVGNRYDMVGYDGFEEDYYSLCGYEAELAETEAGKRLMRKTKSEMIASIGQAIGTLIAFLDLRDQYYALKVTLDILRDENHTILQVVNKIEEAYELAAERPDQWWSSKEGRAFDQLTDLLPPRLWVE